MGNVGYVRCLEEERRGAERRGCGEVRGWVGWSGVVFKHCRRMNQINVKGE